MTPAPSAEVTAVQRARRRRLENWSRAGGAAGAAAVALPLRVLSRAATVETPRRETLAAPAAQQSPTVRVDRHGLVAIAPEPALSGQTACPPALAPQGAQLERRVASYTVPKLTLPELVRI